MAAGDRVIVAGAGIGGLTTAVGLRKAGIDVLLLERMSEHRELGAGVTLAPNATGALRRLGLLGELTSKGNALRDFNHVRSDGSPITSWSMEEIQSRVGEPTISLTRPALQRILLDALDGAELRLSAEVVGVETGEDGVTAKLADGSEERGRALVAADGLHSTIRPQFDPTPLRYAGFTAWRGLARLGDPPATRVPLDVQVQSYGRGSVFGTIPLGPELVYWYATKNTAEGGTDEPGRRKSSLLELLSGWHEPISTLIEASDESEISRSDVYDLPARERWGEGCTTLLGDAAHPTTPTLGQGACLAIEDGVVLASCLDREADAASALRAYERKRIPRTSRTVKQSGGRAKKVQVDGTAAVLFRDLMLRALPKRLVYRNLERVFRFEG